MTTHKLTRTQPLTDPQLQRFITDLTEAADHPCTPGEDHLERSRKLLNVPSGVWWLYLDGEIDIGELHRAINRRRQGELTS